MTALQSPLVLALLALPLAAQEGKPLQQPEIPEIFAIGKPVDMSITLRDIDGKEHALKAHEGKTIVIDFWSNRCPWSRKAESELIALQKDFAAKGVVFLAIDSNKGDIADGEKDHFAEIRKYNEENGVPYPILLDPGNVIADRFKAQTTPHLFVIDPEGILRYDGGLNDDPKGSKGDQATPWARNAIAAVIAGKQVPAAKTKAFGCTIKRVQKKKQADG